MTLTGERRDAVEFERQMLLYEVELAERRYRRASAEAYEASARAGQASIEWGRAVKRAEKAGAK